MKQRVDPALAAGNRVALAGYAAGTSSGRSTPAWA